MALDPGKIQRAKLIRKLRKQELKVYNRENRYISRVEKKVIKAKEGRTRPCRITNVLKTLRRNPSKRAVVQLREIIEHPDTPPLQRAQASAILLEWSFGPPQEPDP